MTIYLLVGLPCSGKTHYMRNYMKGVRSFDDISQNGGIEQLNDVQDDEIVISDVAFCFVDVRKSAEEKLLALFPNAKLKWIWFENSPDKCLNNMRMRIESGDDRKVENAIKSYAKKYEVPEGVKPLVIWQRFKFSE